MLKITRNGKEINSWNEIQPAYEYGALSGVKRNDCDIAGLPAGEPKPVTLYNVPMECEPDL